MERCCLFRNKSKGQSEGLLQAILYGVHMIWLTTLSSFAEIFYVHFFYSDNEFLKPLSDDLKTKIKAWNDIDVKIFTKANETFWERYKAIPNVEKLEQEFKYETGSFTWRLTKGLSSQKPKYSIYHF